MSSDEADTARSTPLREITLRFGYLRRVALVALNPVLAAHDLTPPGFHVLFRLATEGGELPQQELALDVELDPAGVSRLLSRMIDRGLLTAARDPSDRRRRIVQLTDAGRGLYERLDPEVDAAIRDVVVGLTPEEERTLLRLLDKAASATRERELREEG
ncbi:MAG TPA: MarR family transcriptional regulator [Sandaracinaceae bacterium LLY-WYZ-13_1]|nr:MarR family transcriptional regulator [Sandaracinaceae bacterium LLY-WYZ-13_1]